MAFRVGSTPDLRTASGDPCFAPAAFEELARNPDIEWEWIPEDVDEITPDIAARYDGLHLNGPKITAASLARSDRRVRIVARNGVGYDTVDLAACAARGVLVTNTPVAVRRPVAVAALTLVFALAGKLFVKDRLVRDGRWNERVDHMGVGLSGRTLGVVGAGGVGRELIALAAPFFDAILVADPYADPGQVAALGARPASLDQVLTRSDFVVAACLLNDETRHLFDALAFSRMKPSACFVNVARGPVHDEAALIEALREGRIHAAGLDVLEREPPSRDNPLLGMDNVIVTPHALCWTDECFEDIARAALRSIVDASLGVEPEHLVTA